jgi:hypothetical protein
MEHGRYIASLNPSGIPANPQPYVCNPFHSHWDHDLC